MQIIGENIIFSGNINNEITKLFELYPAEKIFVITDNNVFKHCFNYINKAIFLKKNIFILQSGEANKTLGNLARIWDFFIDNKADKKSLIINFGGGVVCDIGGFAASTFKRGVKYINIPTTLLSQVDAAIGGKTGINFKSYKNELGVINFPKKVIIYPEFTKTLEKEEFLSGFAEMIKHGFIYSKKYLDELFTFIEEAKDGYNYNVLKELIKTSVNIKLHFIKNDIYDSGERKILNFGHTFGHAIESFINESGNHITHGKAVAHGIVFELFLSNKKLNYNLQEFLYYSQKIINSYNVLKFKKNDIRKITNLMFHDKKNTFDKIYSILLKNIENATIDNEITEENILESFNFYLQLSK